MVRSAVASDVEEWFRNETVVFRQKGASTKIFEGDFKLLDFSPTNNPAWRQGTSLPDTSRMLQDLMQWSEQYRASSVAPAVLPAFQKHLTGRLIFFNNKAEEVQRGATDAMFFLHKLRNDRLQQGQSAAESIILSPKVVIKAHTILMAGLVDRAGQLRDEYSYAGVPGGGKFYYDPPCLIPCSFSRCLELYTALLSGLAADWDTVHATPALFNLAALVFVQLITIHPFEDGRLLRLLANFVLGAITPFPIPAYIEDGIRSRRTYIDAIMAARNLADATLTRVGPPKDLSALFIECAWQSWQEFVRMLDRSVFLQSMRGRLLASTFSPARYSLLKDIGLSQQEKEAEIAALQHAIDREHTEANNIKPGHAREIVVDLARDTFVTAIVLKPKMSFG